MPKLHLPPSLSKAGKRQSDGLEDGAPRQIEGYVRSGVSHIQAVWSFEVLNDKAGVALATIQTADGAVCIGLNRDEAKDLHQMLGLFITQWPEGKTSS
jgi:hypothetical protein